MSVPKPFDPEDPVHAAALALIKAERMRITASGPAYAMAARAVLDAKPNLLSAITEALQAAGNRGELDAIALPRL